MSFVIWKVLPDNPETARFLTNKEKEFIINRALETGSGHGRVTNVDRIRLHHVSTPSKTGGSGAESSASGLAASEPMGTPPLKQAIPPHH